MQGSVLRRWVQECTTDSQQAFPGQGQMKPEQAELARLRREVVKLTAERDILKQAAAFFARESRAGDLTVIATRAGWVYLAVILDLYSHRVIGWAMSPRPDPHVALTTLQMAMTHRRRGLGSSITAIKAPRTLVWRTATGVD